MFCFFFFQAEDGIRDLVRSRGLGDVYKRQVHAYIQRRPARGGVVAQGDDDQFGLQRAGAGDNGLSLIHI